MGEACLLRKGLEAPGGAGAEPPQSARLAAGCPSRHPSLQTAQLSKRCLFLPLTMKLGVGDQTVGS